LKKNIPGNIETAQERARKEKRAVLVVYYPFGFPDIPKSMKALKELSSYADIIEIGVPFSDPVADGPVIQMAYNIAVKNGSGLPLLFKHFITEELDCPAVIMSYLNPIYRYGTSKFIKDAEKLGFVGVIIPDMPPEEKKRIFGRSSINALDFIYLASPTDSRERLQEIARLTEGFLYLVSSLGVTGEREFIQKDIGEKVNCIRSIRDIPIYLGFGISKPEHVRELSPFVDGFIVGSAVVRRILEAESFEEGLTAACKLLEKLKKASKQN
jgi:tryptophan synthase alpha chain